MFNKQSYFRICLVLLIATFMLALVGPAQAAEVAASPISSLATEGNSAKPDTAQVADTKPTYAITWTHVATKFSDDTSLGYRTVQNEKLMSAGSATYHYDANKFVYLPSSFVLTFTDDAEFTYTSLTECQKNYSSRHITDPNRYTGDLNDFDVAPLLLTPMQQDGSWSMGDPLLDIELNGTVSGHLIGLFNYSYHTEDTYPPDCNRQDDTYTGEQYPPAIPGIMQNYAIDLKGDANGKVFTKNVEYTDISGWVSHEQITVRILESGDLTVNSLEVTQGLQDEANTIPLIQGRRTVVRAYVNVGADQKDVPNVTGTLWAYVGTTPLGSASPFNPGRKITARVNPDWHEINNTLNFEVPYTWTLIPNLRLQVQVNPYRTIAESNYDNNTLDAIAPFLPCAGGVNVTYLPIHYTPPGGYSPADPSANISAAWKFMQKIYPIPDKGLAYFPRRGITYRKDVNEANNSDELVEILSTQLLSSTSPRAAHIYGWLPSLAFQSNGWGDMPGVAAIGNDSESPNLWRRTFAHEIGHNYGLDHSDLTTDGRHWFDVYERVIPPVPASVGGKDLLDVMVPARLEPEAWISPQNYEYLINQICSASAAPAPAPIQSATAGDTLLITGLINNTTPFTGSFDPLYHFTTIPTYTLPAGTQACVNLKNNTDALLSQYCFDPDFIDESGTPAADASFGMVVPYPAGLDHVELVRDGSILSIQTASPNPPGVTVTFPNAAGLTLSGSQDITWAGSDADGNPLTYNILYSRDNGATWMGISNGITGSTYNIDFSGLPGTTGASGKIKVMVSDGFNSAEDVSDNPFSIANKPPEAVILSPSTGTEFATGPQIVLEGAGMDLENGSLSDSALSWSSSIDDALGTGRLLEVNLSPGVHTITLTAADSDGLTSSESIQITVIKPPLAVVSSLRADPNPTSASSVKFTVTFSEAVTGVDATDFILTASGITGVAVAGVTGSGAVYTITASTGSGNGTLRLDVIDNDTILDAALSPLGGAGVGNGNFTTGEEYAVNKSLTSNSIGAQDGWILESAETSNKGGTMNSSATTLSLGDNAQKRQYRTVLSFKTDPLPDNATITKVTLKLKRSAVLPAGTNPISSLQGIFVDIRKGFFGTSANLQLTDFQATASKTAGTFKPILKTGWYTINLNNMTFSSINKLKTSGGLTQIRLRFKLDDDNNAISNYLNLFSGSAPTASRPQLIIEYYVP